MLVGVAGGIKDLGRTSAVTENLLHLPAFVAVDLVGSYDVTKAAPVRLRAFVAVAFTLDSGRAYGIGSLPPGHRGPGTAADYVTRGSR
jgi:hypothetical protein